MPITLAELLDTPFGSTATARVLPEGSGEVSRATFLDSTADVDALRTGAVVVLSPAALAIAGSYEFDVLVRHAIERGVVALLLRKSTRRSLTAEDLARRGGLALIEVADDADPLEVFDWLGSAISGDARAALARLAAAVAYEPRGDARAEEVVRELSRLSGFALELSDSDDAGSPIDIDGRRSGSVRTSESGHAADVAAHLTAAVLSALLTSQERNTLRPVRSTASALNQLLLCSPANLATASARAVEVGFEVDRWHCAARVAIDVPGSDDGGSAVEEDLLKFVARRVADPVGSWTIARPDASLILVRTSRADPGRQSGVLMRRTLYQLVDEVLTRHPAARVRIGLATAHQGAAGLRASAEEARIALASAQLADGAVGMADFDAAGVRRMLAEWLTSESAREAVQDLLAPLDALGGERAQVAVETLHAYLDEHGSYQRAAERLRVHRNTVVYRITQILESLPTDITDPDEWFALQLACRARLLPLGGP